jgi:hypothetical protein
LYIKLTELALIVLLSSLLKKVDHVVKFTMIEGMGMTQDKGHLQTVIKIYFFSFSGPHALADPLVFA